MKINKKHRLIIINQILVVPLIITVTACSTYQRGWKGAVARPESRVDLRGVGIHKDSLETNDLLLEYEYTRNRDNLMLSGYVQLADRLSANYEYVSYFFLTLNFLDSEGRMLARQTAMTYMSGYRIDDKWYFKRKLITPPGTAAFAFSYNGRVVEAERDAPGDLSFYMNPLEKAEY